LYAIGILNSGQSSGGSDVNGFPSDEQLFKAIGRAERELKVFVYQVSEEFEETCIEEDGEKCPCSV
jgi:hypothetical protein